MGLPHIHEKLVHDLRLIDWAQIVHPSVDGYVTIATRSQDGWKEQPYTVDSWYEHIVQQDDIDCYYTPNTVYKPHRTVENARHINAFYVDLDFYKFALSFEETLDAIDFLVRTERLLEPTFIVYSGQGIYLFWQIESVPAKYKQVLKLFGHIQTFLIDTLKELGADPQVKDVVRVLRVPTSINTKTGQTVRILRYSEKFYTMRCLQQFMNDALMVELNAKRKPSKKKKAVGKVKYLYNYFTLAVARASDLRTLCKLRDYDIDGYRNAFLHVYAYQMFLVHNNYHVARNFIMEFNEALRTPLPKPEVEAVVKSTFKAYERNREDISKGYNYKNETLIELLAITTDEQRELKTIISEAEVAHRRNEKKRINRRSENGLTARERLKEDIKKQVFLLLNEGLKQKEICEKLGLSKGYVSKLVKSLKNQ